MKREVRVALLADLDEPLHAGSRSDAAAFSYELAAALKELASNVGGIAVDLVARRGSENVLPLISVDPDELGVTDDDDLARFARREAMYCQLFGAGMLTGYDVVHAVAPLVAPLLLIARTGTAIAVTETTNEAAIQRRILARLVPSARLAWVEVGTAGSALEQIDVAIDLARFRPPESPHDDHLVWLGSGGPDAEVIATQIAAAAGLPLRVGQDSDVALLQHARCILHLESRPRRLGAIWPLRALACGAAVAGWIGGGVDAQLARDDGAAFAPLGDIRALARMIRELPPRREASAARRARVVARHGPRSIAARYREVYRKLAGA